MGRMLRASVIRCTADEHEPGCGGVLKDCDKELNPCPYAIMQGPDAHCRHTGELQECKGDCDFCDLSFVEQMKLDWEKKEVAK